MRSQLPQNTVSGWIGLIATSHTPVLSFTNSTWLQLSPPSSLRYRPRSAFVENCVPIAATKTRFLLLGSIATRGMRAVGESPSDLQVRPPSDERNRPEPSYESTEAFASPVPT